MIHPFRLTFGSVAFALASGCATAPRTALPTAVPAVAPARAATVPSSVVQAQHSVAVPAVSQVDDWVKIAVERNPRLAKAQFVIDSAQGKTVQAGLYPNPVLAFSADELSDKMGPGGILTLPQFNQEIVTGRKLSLSQAVAAKEVDLATLSLLRERYEVIGGVRAAYYELFSQVQKIAALDELTRAAAEGVQNGQKLLENKQIARLDLVQLEVELEKFRAKAEAARQELPWARKRLAAAVGDSKLTVAEIAGPFDDVPLYDADRTLDAILATHPDVRSARVNVEKAQAAIRRAEAEAKPNLTFSTGYTYQGQNRSNDWLLGLSAPLPSWNRNQGNIRAAKADYGSAVQDVGRVENELTERASAALQKYLSATKEAEQYKKGLIPKAEETYRLSTAAFQGGQIEYPRVVQARQAAGEAKLEYVRALGDAWKAAAELSALLLEEYWPGVPPDRVKVAQPATLIEDGK